MSTALKADETLDFHNKQIGMYQHKLNTTIPDRLQLESLLI